MQLTTLLEDLKNDNNIDVEDKRAIELYYKRIMDILCIPKDEYVAFKRLCDESFDAWILAKSKANYSIFEPYLKRVIESKKKLYGYRNSDKSIYNQMLDDFEPGMSVEKYDIFFEVFPKQLGKVALEDFYKAINASKPSFVRTEADELTYPLHILIRYEIEKGLFDGSISTEGLDKTWNAKYKEYLGIDVPNDRLGILQDVHWSDGSFGYFPTYALGTAFVAQYVHAMKKDIDVDSLLENNHFDEIMKWLKENIHTYGFLYEAPKLMKMITGEDFDVKYFLDYIEEKYTKLY